jgi:hypothetical protein
MAGVAGHCPSNCSLAGICAPNGACTCDAPFTGAACDRLDQLPASSAAAFKAPQGSTTWGGSPIQSDDNRGVYYMFTALSRNTTIDHYSTSGVIITTRSTSPTGPYTMVDAEAGPYTIGPRAHPYWDATWAQNPVVARLHRSRGYLLFYAAGNDTKQSWASGQCSIGVAFATDLAGPWLRPSNPVLQPQAAPHWEDGGISNPAVYVDPRDDSILLGCVTCKCVP